MKLNFIKKNFPKCYEMIVNHEYVEPELKKEGITELEIFKVIFKDYKISKTNTFEVLKQIENKIGVDK
jgi:hypothetical protein